MNYKFPQYYPTAILFFSMLLSSCSMTPSKDLVQPQSEIILATTTSTYDSGLLDVLMPIFEAETGYEVKVIAVGTGKALTMGREGNADLLLVHAPPDEEIFMAEGYGNLRLLVMHNDFIFVGPSTDPARIYPVIEPSEIVARIAENQGVFISRGDDSGTHKKEMQFWEQAGINPNGAWYLESGQGMGATLMIASEKGAYTLTDRSTYLFLRENLTLDILAEGSPPLMNIYHVITINPELWPNVNIEGANALAEFLISPIGQEIIATHGIKDLGQPLFFPDAQGDL
ncbi:MAG: substrate-binding domain-containing protein [Chloroflexi bacterium]|nr:substrate-binding domain-containing protein [Chloroflexota bacterium]